MHDIESLRPTVDLVFHEELQSKVLVFHSWAYVLVNELGHSFMELGNNRVDVGTFSILLPSSIKA